MKKRKKGEFELKKLFVDMDGVLARFYEDPAYEEKMHDQGYFAGLRPYEAMLAAVDELRKRNDLRVYILSASPNPIAAAEKENWIAQLLQGYPIIGVFIVRNGDSKAEYIRSFFGELTQDDYLLDDHSANLVDWAAHGGFGIKFLNEFNGKGLNGVHWKGTRLNGNTDAEEICEELCRILGIN